MSSFGSFLVERMPGLSLTKFFIRLGLKKFKISGLWLCSSWTEIRHFWLVPPLLYPMLHWWIISCSFLTFCFEKRIFQGTFPCSSTKLSSSTFLGTSMISIWKKFLASSKCSDKIEKFTMHFFYNVWKKLTLRMILTCECQIDLFNCEIFFALFWRHCLSNTY